MQTRRVDGLMEVDVWADDDNGSVTFAEAEQAAQTTAGPDWKVYDARRQNYNHIIVVMRELRTIKVVSW